jgi:tetratricopeptide (TPR) repeat protein
LNYQLIGRADDQIKEQYAANPKELTLEEILYASILTDDVAKKEEILKTATKIYPNDYRAYNNLGALAYNKGNYDAAKKFFNTAEKINGSAPEVKINLGYMELLKGNVAAAESNITMGADAKAGDEALGNLYIAQGEYGRAAAMLKGNNTNSAALAQLLNKDYSSSRTTLEKIKNPDAMTYYIKAVLGARTANVSLLYDGLKQAVKLDPSMAKKAANDLEFIKYAQDATFQDITK